MKKIIFIFILLIMNFSFITETYAAYPTKYNAANKGYITTPKNQGLYGTCYAFATISAIETNLIKNKKATKNIDLSEYQLIYELSKEYGFNHKDILSDNMNINKTHMFLIKDFYLTTENKINYNLIKKKIEPTTASLSSGNISVKNTYKIKTTQNNIKGAIGKYGSVVISLYSDESYFNAKETTYNLRTTKYVGTNHAIVIIGWDDNYSKNNFKYKPKKNGAWLCRNSWGTKWGDNGYFWISYENNNFSNHGYVYEADIDSKYYARYEYDKTDTNYYLGDISLQGNIYTAKNAEIISDVMIYSEDTDCKYNIYYFNGDISKYDVEHFKNNSTLIKSDTALYPGYYTINISKKILLNKGQVYSIIVEFLNKNNDYGQIAFDEVTNKNNKSYVVFNEANTWYDMNNINLCCRIKVGTKRALEIGFTKKNKNAIYVTAYTSAYIINKKYYFKITDAKGKIVLNTGYVNKNVLTWIPKIRGLYLVQVYCKDTNTGILYGRARYYNF